MSDEPAIPPALLRLHPRDTVAVAVSALAEGQRVPMPPGGQAPGATGGGWPAAPVPRAEVTGGQAARGTPLELTLADDVPAGHKVALCMHDAGADVFKYGAAIGRALTAIAPGAWVHTHNLRSNLDRAPEYEGLLAALTAHPAGDASGAFSAGPAFAAGFAGYRRPDGRVGTRNELWIIPTVGCVNAAAQETARAARRLGGGTPGFDGAIALTHQYGCSQLGDDLERTAALLEALAVHPNAGAVLLFGLGCENNELAALAARVRAAPRYQGAHASRVATVAAQEVEDEVAVALAAALRLVAVMAGDRRTPRPASDLVLGLKCGGSDAFSGITANPLLGAVAEALAAAGGTALLSEIPELFGAEAALFPRCVDQACGAALARLLRQFRRWYEDAGHPPYENPSPGNKAGGITTLEEKSLGCVTKGGRTPVRHVLPYAAPVPPPGAARGGLGIVEAPGNDAVSGTALAAAGATVLLFTTGRGTPLGFPVPTLKIATNSALAAHKRRWIDFDAGRLLAGAGRAALADELAALVGRTASGEFTPAHEAHDSREIAVFKTGVIL